MIDAKVTWLYAPAYKSNLIDRAEKCGADVCVFDLEDSVPDGMKHKAQSALIKQLPDKSSIPTAVRINSLSTDQGISDLLSIRGHGQKLDIMLIPKAKITKDCYLVERLLSSGAPGVSAIIESVDGYSELRKLENPPKNLKSITFGSLDFAADMCVSPLEFDFTRIKSELVWHAKRLGLKVIDTPCFNIRDPKKITEDATASRDLGFDGKVAIHPDQVSLINEQFAKNLQQVKDMALDIKEHGKGSASGLKNFGDMAYGPPIVRYVENILGGDRKT